LEAGRLGREPRRGQAVSSCTCNVLCYCSHQSFTLQIKGIIKEQYDRALSFSKHFADVGRSLDTAVRRYNDAVGSLESRLLASTRKMKVLGAIGGDDIPDAATVDRPIRPHHPPAEDDEDRPLAGAGAVAAALSAGSAGNNGADVSASAQRKAPRAPRTPAPP